MKQSQVPLPSHAGRHSRSCHWPSRTMELRSADEMRRDALPPSLELALVEEAETWRQERDDGGRFVHARGEARGSPGLVVILEESGEPVLIVESGEEMLAHRPRVTLAQPIVEPLVVSVVEALLHHGPLEIPIHLRHEREARCALPRPADRLRPEQWRPSPPGPLEDVRQDEHGHVAADAVALASNPEQLADHRLLRGRIAVVELQRVRPAVEVRVTAIGDDSLAPL